MPSEVVTNLFNWLSQFGDPDWSDNQDLCHISRCHQAFHVHSMSWCWLRIWAIEWPADRENQRLHNSSWTPTTNILFAEGCSHLFLPRTLPSPVHNFFVGDTLCMTHRKGDWLTPSLIIFLELHALFEQSPRSIAPIFEHSPKLLHRLRMKLSDKYYLSQATFEPTVSWCCR